MKFPKKREKDYTIKIRIFHHSTKKQKLFFTPSKTFEDICGHLKTSADIALGRGIIFAP